MLQQQKKVKYRRGFKKWSDEKAIELRRQLGLKDFSSLCAFELCKHLNITVLEPNQISGLPIESINELLGPGSSHWSAASVPIKEDKYLIIHNPLHSEARQQSNLMHELAHIICKHKVPNEKQNLGLSGFLRNHDEEQENEAEWFGSCLQLPRPALLWALRNKMGIDEIASHFNASSEMVRYRINITGVKRQLNYIKT